MKRVLFTGLGDTAECMNYYHYCHLVEQNMVKTKLPEKAQFLIWTLMVH